MNRYLLTFALIFFAPLAVLAQPARPRPEPDVELRDYIKAHYTKYEYRIPMRDGAKLFTAVYVPKDDSQTYPILLTRTPVQLSALRRRQVPRRPPARRAVRQGRLHLRLPGRARPLDVRGRVRQHAAAQPGEEGQGDRREQRHLRHDRLAGQERAKATTARSASGASRTPASTPSAGMIDAHPALKAVVAAGPGHRLVHRRRLPPQRLPVPAALLQLHGDLRPAAARADDEVRRTCRSTTARPTATTSSSTWARSRTPTRSTSRARSRSGTR